MKKKVEARLKVVLKYLLYSIHQLFQLIKSKNLENNYLEHEEKYQCETNIQISLIKQSVTVSRMNLVRHLERGLISQNTV